MRFIRTLILFAFIVFLSGDLFAQSCSPVGCLGDNLVVNGDFENFNPGNPFGTFDSQLNFNGPCGPGSNDCGDFLCRGTFAIESSPFPCNPGWSDNIADHTFADGTGNFMVVDFPEFNSQEIWCQTIDLQPNVNYCFGAWFINILPLGSTLPAPEIRFEVDGAFVGISSGIQANEQWSFNGVIVSSGAGGPAEFCLINQNFGLNGFDVGIDDISVREVDPNGGPNTIDDIARVCSPTDPVTFNPLVNDSPNGSPIDLSTFGIFTAPPFSQGTITNVDQINGNITFQPVGNFAGTSFEYVICDEAGCCQIATVDVTINPDINLTTTGDDLTCATLGTGTVGVNATGGTAPYTYTWDNADNVQNPTGLNPGVFTVTVTDAFGCQETATAQITGPPAVEFDLVPTNISCFGEDDGSIQLTTNSGLAPFDFNWDNAPDVQSPSSLSAGIYTVTVTDGNACFATGSAEIIEPAELTGGVTLNNGVSCNGEADGSATVDAGGGTPPFTYLWDNGDGDATQNTLTGGISSVTVTDNNGCTIVESIDVPEPSVLGLSINETDAICLGADNGSAEAIANGGTLPYTFAWSTGETNQQINDLAPGTYDITLTDNNGCDVEASFDIGESDPFQATIQTTQATCDGVDNGTGTVIPINGVAPYTFLFDNGETTNPAVNLAGGQHTVNIQDSQGCFLDLNFEIGTSTNLEIDDIATVDVSCFGGSDGSASATISGGGAPFTYLWDTPNPQSGPNATGLVAGTYNLSVEDVGGCTSSVVEFTIDEPEALDLELMATPPSCFGDSNALIFPILDGGFPPYEFEWNTGATTDTISNLPEGFYALTVVDVNGCITEVDTFLAQPDTLNAFVTSMDISCFGEVDGIITVDSVLGGTPPFVYALDGVTFQPSGIFTGLPRGEYTITIEDVNGCSITRDAFIDEPFELSVFAGEDLFLELGDSAQLFGQINTTAPVSVSWEPPLYLDCVDCPDPTVRPFESVEYTFTAVDSNGCIATDDLLVDLRKIFDVYIPNAFSPNGDGVNDVFMIFGGKSVDVVLNFQVFDRWGERLYDARNFRTDDPRFGWDGTLSGRVMNPGVFVYFAEILYIDGTIVPVKGDVTLVR